MKTKDDKEENGEMQNTRWDYGETHNTRWEECDGNSFGENRKQTEGERQYTCRVVQVLEKNRIKTLDWKMKAKDNIEQKVKKLVLG